MLTRSGTCIASLKSSTDVCTTDTVISLVLEPNSPVEEATDTKTTMDASGSTNTRSHRPARPKRSTGLIDWETEDEDSYDNNGEESEDEEELEHVDDGKDSDNGENLVKSRQCRNENCHQYRSFLMAG